MKRMLSWFTFGVLLTLSVIMIVFGVLFIKDVYLHSGEAVFGSLLFGIILLVVGGGLLSSTIAETVRKLCQDRR
jgi:hypothetical protein